MSTPDDRAVSEHDPYDNDIESRESARLLRTIREEHERWSREHSKVAHLDRSGEPTWVRLKR